MKHDDATPTIEPEADSEAARWKRRAERLEQQLDEAEAALDDARPRIRKAATRTAPTRKRFDGEEWGKKLAALVRGYVEPVKQQNAELIKRLEALETRTVGGHLAYAGAWRSGITYEQGTMATFRGSLWHANATTDKQPGDQSSGWQLCVKRGRDGRRDAHSRGEQDHD